MTACGTKVNCNRGVCTLNLVNFSIFLGVEEMAFYTPGQCITAFNLISNLVREKYYNRYAVQKVGYVKIYVKLGFLCKISIYNVRASCVHTT